MQPIHQRKTCGVSKTFTSPNNAAPRKHGRIIQTNQKRLPYATGTIEKLPDSVKILNLYNRHTIVQSHIKTKDCKYPVVYRQVKHVLYTN